MTKLTIEYVSIETPIASEYNPREMTEKQAEDLSNSLKRFGLVDPLIVNKHKDRKNILVGGHQRLIIAKKLGHKEVPVTYVNLSLEMERELNIRLNQNSGQWDWDALGNFFDPDELMTKTRLIDLRRKQN